MLRILAERNRPHGQMLGEEAQEALQGEKHGVPVCDDFCMVVAVPRAGSPSPCGRPWGLSCF